MCFPGCPVNSLGIFTILLEAVVFLPSKIALTISVLNKIGFSMLFLLAFFRRFTYTLLNFINYFCYSIECPLFLFSSFVNSEYLFLSNTSLPLFTSASIIALVSSFVLTLSASECFKCTNLYNLNRFRILPMWLSLQSFNLQVLLISQFLQFPLQNVSKCFNVWLAISFLHITNTIIMLTHAVTKRIISSLLIAILTTSL